MTYERTPEDMLRHTVGGGVSDLLPAIVSQRAERAYEDLHKAAHERCEDITHRPFESIEVYDFDAGSPNNHHFYFFKDMEGAVVAHVPDRDGTELHMIAEVHRHPTTHLPRDVANMAVMATIMEERLARLDEKGVWLKIVPGLNKH